MTKRYSARSAVLERFVRTGRLEGRWKTAEGMLRAIRKKLADKQRLRIPGPWYALFEGDRQVLTIDPEGRDTGEWA